MDGHDTLVVMPTGGGKSLCYQVPALAMDGLTIVVSPLIALMQDQVNALLQLGVSAATFHSNLSMEESSSINQKLHDGKLKLLYVSPEKLSSEGFIRMLRTYKVSLFAIDEAHCVSTWGNDFRPDYVRLRIIKEQFPNIPVVALTATADSTTQDDILVQLKLSKPKKFINSFERKNITQAVSPGKERLKQIYNFIGKHQGQAGIVYCLSRKGTESLAEKLESRGLQADYYHAGRSAEDRARVQQAFQEDSIDIICATIAFGMGIDKPNIRWVIHYNMPKNLEAYYQEIGRSGRDGAPAEALLFYSWADMSQLSRFITEGNADATFKEIQTAKLERMWQYANAQSCRTNFILNYFGEYRSEGCGHCDNCIYPPQFIDGTTYAKMALSGVIRCHEKLTLQVLMDLLKGSYKQEIRHLALDQIKTFGAGRELPYPHWASYLNQMINLGILRIDLADGSKIKTTPLSKPVLTDELPVSLAQYEKPQVKKEKKIKHEENMDYDSSLFDQLKKWRLGKARVLKVPPYVIMHDRTLKAIAAAKPSDDNQLLNIDGIGKAKLEKFGADILSLVN